MHVIHIPLFILFLVRAAFATLFSDPAQLTKSTYDFVVVGGGTAGNVVATRLSENPQFSVLVIEAGGNNAGIVETMIPFTAPTVLTNSSLIWNYTTVPQPALDNRVLPYQRGRLLGGSSSVNFMVFTRGSRDDFDRFANVTGDPGWSWDAMFPFMLKAESFTPPVDHHNTTGQFNPSVHGHSGPLRTTLPGFPSDLDPRLLATTQADPVHFPFNLDTNSGDTIGISWTQSTTGFGERSSSATAYLQPALQRPNLDILIQTQVTRLVNISRNNTKPDLREVEFAQSSTSPHFTVRAKKEVILSAGPINTPQLLLLSGVGDMRHLSSLGIPTVVRSPGVGQNLQDHPLLANEWFVNSNNTLDNIARNATLANELLVQWEQTRTGQFVDTGGNQFAWLRIPSNSSMFNGFEDPAAGPTSSHMELFMGNEFASFLGPPPATGSFISIITGVVSPASRGNVTLASSDPFAFPVIDPGFMTHPLDVAVMIEAIRTSERLLATTPWQGFVIKPFGALQNATTDEELAAYVRSGIVTFWHPSCTAKMGSNEDEMAVVDPSLRLKGAFGLRVVDASVFPFIPASHLQAPVYAVAERAAHLIQNAWSSGD